MRVRIGDQWHSPENEMIVIELNDTDRSNIAHMHHDATMYAAYPDSMSPTLAVEILDRLAREHETQRNDDDGSRKGE